MWRARTPPWLPSNTTCMTTPRLGEMGSGQIRDCIDIRQRIKLKSTKSQFTTFHQRKVPLHIFAYIGKYETQWNPNFYNTLPQQDYITVVHLTLSYITTTSSRVYKLTSSESVIKGGCFDKNSYERYININLFIGIGL